MPLLLTLQWGNRPLHWAAQHGQTDVVTALLEAGADPASLENVSGEGFVELGLTLIKRRVISCRMKARLLRISRKRAAIWI